jgi:DNA-binding SARP family transcriptional activator
MNARMISDPQTEVVENTWYLAGGIELPADLDAPTATPLQMLALLAIEAGKLVTFSSLTDELWDGDAPMTARNILHSFVQRIRKQLGDKGRNKNEQLLRAAHGGYRLCINPEQVDVLRFISTVQSITLRGNEDDDQLYKILTDLSAAFKYLRGPLLCDVRQGTLLSRWVQWTDELHRIARGQWVEAALRLGRHREVLGELTKLSLGDPAHEEFARWRILALYCGGRKANALDAYTQLRTAMVSQLGVEPSPMTMDLHNRILDSDLAPTQRPQRFI